MCNEDKKGRPAVVVMMAIQRALLHLRSASQPDTTRPTELDIPTTDIKGEASEDDKPDWTAI